MVTLEPNLRSITSLLFSNNVRHEPAANEMLKVLIVRHYLLGSSDPATLRTACSMSLSLGVRGKLDASKKWYKAVLGRRIGFFLRGKHVDTHEEIDVESISAGNGELKVGGSSSTGPDVRCTCGLIATTTPL